MRREEEREGEERRKKEKTKRQGRRRRKGKERRNEKDGAGNRSMVKEGTSSSGVSLKLWRYKGFWRYKGLSPSLCLPVGLFMEARDWDPLKPAREAVVKSRPGSQPGVLRVLSLSRTGWLRPDDRHLG